MLRHLIAAEALRRLLVDAQHAQAPGDAGVWGDLLRDFMALAPLLSRAHLDALMRRTPPEYQGFLARSLILDTPPGVGDTARLLAQHLAFLPAPIWFRLVRRAAGMAPPRPSITTLFLSQALTAVLASASRATRAYIREGVVVLETEGAPAVSLYPDEAAPPSLTDYPRALTTALLLLRRTPEEERPEMALTLLRHLRPALYGRRWFTLESLVYLLPHLPPPGEWSRDMAKRLRTTLHGEPVVMLGLPGWVRGHRWTLPKAWMRLFRDYGVTLPDAPETQQAVMDARAMPLGYLQPYGPQEARSMGLMGHLLFAAFQTGGPEAVAGTLDRLEREELFPVTSPRGVEDVSPPPAVPWLPTPFPIDLWRRMLRKVQRPGLDLFYWFNVLVFRSLFPEGPDGRSPAADAAAALQCMFLFSTPEQVRELIGLWRAHSPLAVGLATLLKQTEAERTPDRLLALRRLTHLFLDLPEHLVHVLHPTLQRLLTPGERYAIEQALRRGRPRLFNLLLHLLFLGEHVPPLAPYPGRTALLQRFPWGVHWSIIMGVSKHVLHLLP